MAGSIMQCDNLSKREDFAAGTSLGEDSGLRHHSHTTLKSSIIPPRDIIAPIPESLLRYLHEELDSPRFRQLGIADPRLAQMEATLIDRLFPADDPRCFISALRSHAEATAIAARMVAEAVGLPPDMAYLCGWLHDLGIASCLRHAEQIFPVADDVAFERLEPTLSRSEVAHAIRLSTFWRLPSGIRFAIRDHIGFSTLTRPILTAAATVIAEYSVSQIGILPHRSGLSRYRIIRRAGERIGLAEQALGNLIQQIQTKLRTRNGSSHA